MLFFSQILTWLWVRSEKYLMPTELRLHGKDGSNYELSLNIIRLRGADGSKWEHWRAEGAGGWWKPGDDLIKLFWSKFTYSFL